ncbi:hypothetical protein [Fictibacillus phosphorivorans]|uniref:hypothetical protein n=1 Tax=Fictibacillus phosphorivorans TaxID=1221500 RepID=UPI00203F234E|nr:hypothetical protein [Fictibacillus phosphorivorans]MCM3776222.1 hypothetical protein [Fictibacillus phosphorivorans]
MRIHTFVMTAIETPEELVTESLEQEKLPDYEFNKKDLFTAYSLPTGERLFKDQNDQWYAAAHFVKDSLHAVKYGRQIFRPPYKEISEEELSFVEVLEKNGFVPLNPHYDKALCHVVAEVEKLEELSLEMQSRLAHADGDDDPQVAHSLHYMESKLDGKRSRFISGWESHSFATITESSEFADDILMPVSSWLYLLYFSHFLDNQGTMASDQMMPRLLGNLWASTMKEFPYNKELIRILPLS